MARGLARDEHRAEDVRLPDAEKLFRRLLDQRSEDSEAGVVDQHIVVAIFLHYRRDQPLHVVFVADIGDDGERAELLRRGLQHVGVPGTDGDARAAVAEQPRGLESDSAAPACDKYRGILQIHCFSLAPTASRTSAAKSAMSDSSVSKDVMSRASDVASFHTWNAQLCCSFGMISEGSVTNTSLACTCWVIATPFIPASSPANSCAIRLEWLALRFQRSLLRSALNCAAMNLILDASCIPCIRLNSKSSASACLKKTTASPATRPFFVPPKESASTPAALVIAFSGTPRLAAALKMRAPSMWRSSAWVCAKSAIALISCGV